ncbi:MAG: MATE family efflux transporter [Burkholderiales bacterium]
MSTARAQRLLHGPVIPTLARLAAPGALLALFQTAVSIADTYFVGQLGTAALAGISLAIGLSVALFPAVWIRIFSDDPAVLATGSPYLRIVAPFYVLFGAGMALYFASQGAGRMVLPVLAGTVRLAFVVLAGALVVALDGPLWAIFAVIAGGIVLFGGLIIAAVRAGRWEG